MGNNSKSENLSPVDICGAHHHHEDVSDELKEDAGGSVSSLQRVFLLPELAQHILLYVIEVPESEQNQNSIENCKNVCQLWNALCTEFLESKRCVFIEEPEDLCDSEDESDYEKYLGQIQRKNQSFLCELMPVEVSTVVFERIGFQIKNLQLNINDGFVVRELEVFLNILGENCRNLETLCIQFCEGNRLKKKGYYGRLIMESNKCFLPIKTLIAVDVNNPKQLKWMQKVIEFSPQLSKIALTTDENPVVLGLLRIIINSPVHLNKLKELCLPRPFFVQSESANLVNYFVFNPWKITSLQACFRDEIILKQLQTLLTSLKDTLEKLKIDFDPCLLELIEDDSEDFENFMIVPTCLTKLKRLVVCHVSSKSLLLGNALLLPKLQSFKFQEWECDCDENDYSLQDIAHWVDLPSKIPSNVLLNELELQLVNDGTMFTLMPNPWLSLKHLEVTIASKDILRAILQNVPSLESFHLFLIGEDKHESWTNALIGRRQAKFGPGIRFDKVSICNLKQLKRLTIRTGISSSPFTDALVYHGLRHLKNLQYIRIPNADFTSFAMGELKSSLLPFCRYEFQPWPKIK